MPGFIAHIGTDKLQFATETRKKLVVNNFDSDGYQVERRVVNKFMNDRLFVDLDDYLIVVEGVVLNNHDLIDKYSAANWQECVIKMYEKDGDAFFNAFRGSFSGLFYDKKQDKWLIYTNHIGDKQVFKYKTPDGYIFASEIGFIVDTCKCNNLPLSIDITAAYCSLTFGFCIEDLTLVKEIRKLPAGHYFKLEKGQIEEIQYHRFSNKPREMTQQEAVEGIDKYFRQAIQRAFEKDKEYGYRHIACLSGGLDSRMTVWVAHEMGYTDQLNITYSQSEYLDFSIAQQIAIDLHHDWLFKPLDGGDFIERSQFLTSLSYGSGFLLGHGNSLENLLDYSALGIIHTGQLGDVVVGSYLKKMEYGQQPKVTDGAYSEKLGERMESYKFKYDYEDSELFMMYNRGFGGISQGLLTFQENTESYSPFTDVDFFEYCYSIPLELRFNHKIYFDWILDKYPRAGEYIWEKSKTKIYRVENRKKRTMHVLGYEIPHFTERRDFLRYLKYFVLRRLGLRKTSTISMSIQDTRYHMNPVGYWYNTNPSLKEFMEEFWSEYSNMINDQNLRTDMEYLFTECPVSNKLQVLSTLSAIRMILTNE